MKHKSDKFEFFWDGPFSNWYPCHFSMVTPYGKKNFICAEQAMMYYKAMMFHDDDIAKQIMKAPTPKEQKALGRKVKNFNEQKWQNECIEIVTSILVHKFGSDRDLRQILFDTGEKELVEASPVDKIWGIGLADDNPLVLDKKNWKGKNFLGICLINARAILRKQNET